jgi:DNA-binding transcriptional LysR family regulator
MSRALERLRDMFGDPLLVRNGRGYERTVRGERVLRDLESLMPRLEDMVRGEKFDPARSHGVFRMAMSDHASMIVPPSLLPSVRKVATHIKLEVSASGAETYEDVAAGRINTFLCAEEAPPSLESEMLFTLDFVCLVGTALRVRARRLTHQITALRIRSGTAPHRTPGMDRQLTSSLWHDQHILTSQLIVKFEFTKGWLNGDNRRSHRYVISPSSRIGAEYSR